LAIVVAPSGKLVVAAPLVEASTSGYAGSFVARFSDPDRSPNRTAEPCGLAADVRP